MSERERIKFGADRIANRQVDELIGLARGLVADGDLNNAEVEYLHAWLVANLDVLDNPVVGILYDRFAEALKDGVIDAEERQQLFEVVSDFANAKNGLGEEMMPSDLPLCKPAPKIDFAGRRYAFTGTFMFGKRKECEAAVLERGSLVGGIAQSTNILVVGAYCTPSWKHSSFGNKILQAVEWRKTGFPISIISEHHWVDHLKAS